VCVRVTVYCGETDQAGFWNEGYYRGQLLCIRCALDLSAKRVISPRGGVMWHTYVHTRTLSFYYQTRQ